MTFGPVSHTSFTQPINGSTSLIFQLSIDSSALLYNVRRVTRLLDAWHEGQAWVARRAFGRFMNVADCTHVALGEMHEIVAGRGKSLRAPNAVERET